MDSRLIPPPKMPNVEVLQQRLQAPIDAILPYNRGEVHLNSSKRELFACEKPVYIPSQKEINEFIVEKYKNFFVDLKPKNENFNYSYLDKY